MPDTQNNDNNYNDTVHLSEDDLKALKEIIKARQWWNEATKRIKKISIIAGTILTGLAALAIWWPWITRIVQFFIKDIPIT